ncbi:hypothetical protein GLOIN_2v1592050 [Rhizophagus irregularis DAOM 181602=DAOM 197198]|uniref:Uncharacterized protein n=1 Tax=Rhizophagus irregularis (strain DAOM 181602 / DAOM 197198 / MUCL 43194) TaxID=747089 RepID=A0A2P4Q579_RHIID|nr:hypothetical protein GLOIN_2v1592050 [Rhizophagus irregularis DAOM 181602=DAOM 197198]POG72764.1 hypothetical protein GLOIN_2v1592050 [Rhizophagus irregularis DAOM 181602=DAOM 197198]|eukprot:XP_025179630.1 hypothetical protein GLOIN_2v1592050 [Rhizophagus irregularis DAOM 181602=DAOM 197198]
MHCHHSHNTCKQLKNAYKMEFMLVLLVIIVVRVNGKEQDINVQSALITICALNVSQFLICFITCNIIFWYF